MENTFNISENIKRVQNDINEACIKYNRKIEDVSLMAVSKTNPIEKMNAAYDAGLRLFGENRVQELVSKQDFFIKNKDASCHIIGALQTNKVKYLPNITDFIQSADSFKLLNEINKQYLKHEKIAKVLIEINIGNEESKAGIKKDELLDLIYKASEMKNISVQGLMCIPPIAQNDEVRKYFYEMNKLFIDIRAKNIDNICMSVLSMGMSEDYKEAIAEGSTLIRVGRGIFGDRHYR